MFPVGQCLLRNVSKQNSRCLSSKKSSQIAIKKLYQILGVSEDCKDEDLKVAFVNLAKRFHPDSGSAHANAHQFSEIESAYREIQKYRYETRETKFDEEDEVDIKHKAPQHRHYLAHDVGIGTPSVRQRRYATERAQKAAENVMEHRLKKLQTVERNTLVGMDKQKAKDIKTRFGMDRLVEDLIQEAMNKGEFTNLTGMGKPLKDDLSSQNPYVDFVTHKLNQVLIDNGFSPEWIQLSKEIREETNELKTELAKIRCKLGSLPLSIEDEKTWKDSLIILKTIESKINNKIDKYNLLVPILQKQMLQIKLKELADEQLNKPFNPNSAQKAKKLNESDIKSRKSENFFDVISAMFK